MPVKFTFNQGAFNSQVLRLDKLREPKFSKQLGDELGKIITDEMKNLVDKGISPIKGKGRFEPYRNSYRSKIEQGYYPGKGLRPVNLKLTGHMLGALSHAVEVFKSAIRITINYSDDLARKKESGHREGVNNQAQRPTLPQGSEEFSTVITQKVRQRVADFLIKLIKDV